MLSADLERFRNQQWYRRRAMLLARVARSPLYGVLDEWITKVRRPSAERRSAVRRDVGGGTARSVSPHCLLSPTSRGHFLTLSSTQSACLFWQSLKLVCV